MLFYEFLAFGLSVHLGEGLPSYQDLYARLRKCKDNSLVRSLPYLKEQGRCDPCASEEQTKCEMGFFCHAYEATTYCSQYV